jgi:hypothetical protein
MYANPYWMRKGAYSESTPQIPPDLPEESIVDLPGDPSGSLLKFGDRPEEGFRGFAGE